MAPSLRRCFFVLLLFEVLAFRLHMTSMGFYLDDWWEISHTAQRAGYWEGVRGLAATEFYWDRPVNLLLFPLIHRISAVPDVLGPRAWAPQILLTGLETAQAWLLLLLLDGLTRNRRLALAAAALALLFPNRGGTHFRAGGISTHVGLVTALASLVLQLRWLGSRRTMHLAAGQLLYALGLFTYDGHMLAPAFLAGALAARDRVEGKPWRRAASDASRCLAPFALVLGAALLWKWAGVQAFSDAANPKASVISVSVSNVVKVFVAGLGCTTIWPLSLSAVRLADAWIEFGWLLAWLPVLAWWAAREIGVVEEGQDRERRAGMAALAGGAACGFIGTYAPFTLSPAYMPYVNGVMSRLNGTGAWAGGMILAGAYCLLQRRFAGVSGPGRYIPRAALALTLSAFFWTSWVESRAWGQAWSLQKEVLAGVIRDPAVIRGPATIILTGVPKTIRGAPVFDSDMDFGTALRVVTGRQDLTGNVFSAGMQVQDGELVQTYFGRTVYRKPLSSLRVYDHAARRSGPATGLKSLPPVSRSLLFKLFLGPGMEP